VRLLTRLKFLAKLFSRCFYGPLAVHDFVDPTSHQLHLQQLQMHL